MIENCQQDYCKPISVSIPQSMPSVFDVGCNFDPSIHKKKAGEHLGKSEKGSGGLARSRHVVWETSQIWNSRSFITSVRRSTFVVCLLAVFDYFIIVKDAKKTVRTHANEQLRSLQIDQQALFQFLSLQPTATLSRNCSVTEWKNACDDWLVISIPTSDLV